MPVALLLLDYQKGILNSPVIPWDPADAPKTVAAAAEALAKAARAAKVPVVHVGVVRTRARGVFDEKRSQAALASGKGPRDTIALEHGSVDVEFVVAPQAGEDVVHKVGVSGFEGTRLDQVLRNLGVTDVLACGVFTHMAVESTVRQGFDKGYRMAVAAEACASPKIPLHQGSLERGIASFARVLNQAEAMALLRGA